MKRFASASRPRILRAVSFVACTVLFVCVIPLHAAAPAKPAFSTSRIPPALRTAIDRTLGTDQWTQTQEVTQTSPGFTPEFGVAVAIHGSTAMVGAQQQKVGDNEDQGAVFVYQEAGGVWTMTQEILATDGQADDTFGGSIAFNDTTAVIGAFGVSINGNFAQGAAYVFTLADGSWTQTQKLTADDGQLNDQFGYQVGLSGTTAIITADAAQVGSNAFQGAAYVFDGSSGTWTNTQKLSAGDGGIGDIFGIAMSFDGTNAVIGAYGNAGYQGAAYVFQVNDGSWAETQKLVASDGATNTYFGGSIALSGQTLLIGSWGANPGGNDTQGEAYIFTESNGTWTQTQTLLSDDGGPSDKFGHAVALDGTHALIGADGNGAFQGAAQGAVYAFDGSGGTFVQTQKFVASDGQPSYQFGLPIAIDGTEALVGSWLWLSPAQQLQGSAYFFEFGSAPPPMYTIGGTVSGLAGSGLVLQQNGGDDLPIAADGSFTFATPLGNGSAYAITVSVQPGNPMQGCVVTNGSGVIAAADVSNVQVTCSTIPTYTISGHVSGLSGSGLVLQQDGGDNLAIGASGGFTFATALLDGTHYAVSVFAQPTNPAQTCTVANGTGVVDGANVDTVAVNCTIDILDRIFADGFESQESGGGSATLAQTTDMKPLAMNSAACGNSTAGTTADNQYWRRYYFSEHAITTAASVDSVDVSVEQTMGAPNVTVTLYTIPHSVAVDTIDIGQLTQVGQTSVAAPANAALTSINVPITGTVADTVGTDLVVEVATDDGSDDGTAFYIGSTTSAETHPSFISSASCSITDPTPTTNIGYPDMHLIQAVHVTD